MGIQITLPSVSRVGYVRIVGGIMPCREEVRVWTRE